MAATISQLIDRTVAAHARLGELGESLTDEWQYVQDLRAAWDARFAEVRVSRGQEPAGDAATAAIGWLVDEAGRVEDPHRAVDWLSTLPQAALLALHESRF